MKGSEVQSETGVVNRGMVLISNREERPRRSHHLGWGRKRAHRWASGLDAQLFQQALQVVVTAVFDDDPAFLRRMHQSNPSAEVRCQLFFNAGHRGGVLGRQAGLWVVRIRLPTERPTMITLRFGSQPPLQTG